MKYLTEIEKQHPWWKVHLVFRRYYILSQDVTVTVQPYGKQLTLKRGIYDGATWALDGEHKAEDDVPDWLIHDNICDQEVPKFDDGTLINSEMAAVILMTHGRINGKPEWRTKAWHKATKTLGCVSTHVNDK